MADFQNAVGDKIPRALIGVRQESGKKIALLRRRFPQETDFAIKRADFKIGHPDDAERSEGSRGANNLKACERYSHWRRGEGNFTDDSEKRQEKSGVNLEARTHILDFESFAAQ